MPNKSHIDERQTAWKVLLPARPENRVLALGCCDEILCSLRRSFNCVDTLPAAGEKYDIVVLDCHGINYSDLCVPGSCVGVDMVIVCLNANRQIKRTLNARGYHYIKCYAGLPAAKPRIYIPLNTGRLRTRGLSFHNPGSLKARAGLLIARTLSRIGIKSHLMRNTVSIFSASEKISGGNNLIGWISERVGYGISDLVVYAGSESERRKITALAVAEKSEEDVVVKIADSAAGAEAIRQESAALRSLQLSTLSSQVPKLFFEDRWNGYRVQGQSTFSGNSHSQAPCLTKAHFSFLADLSLIDRNFVLFRNTSFFRELDQKLGSIPADTLLPTVTNAWHKILKEDFADWKVLCHRTHGDFTPWNIRKQEGRLFVYDWEESLPEGLALTDALHFVFRQAALVGPWPGSVTMLEKLRETCIRCISDIGCAEKEGYEKYLLAWLIKEYAEKRSDRVAKMIEHITAGMQ